MYLGYFLLYNDDQPLTQARKDLVHCWSILMKQQVGSMFCCVQYIENHLEFLDFLVVWWESKFFFFIWYLFLALLSHAWWILFDMCLSCTGWSPMPLPFIYLYAGFRISGWIINCIACNSYNGEWSCINCRQRNLKMINVSHYWM